MKQNQSNKRKIEVIIHDERLKLSKPNYSTLGSAGIDLKACITDELLISSEDTKLIPSGISIYIKDPKLAGLIIPRSGLGHKKGIVLGNLTGLIDSDYQGQIFISLWNRSKTDFILKPLERVAQLVIVPIVQIEFEIVEKFNKSQRGTRGFGSTGLK